MALEGLTLFPDGHNDLAILIRFLYQNHIYDRNFTQKFEGGGMYGQVDLPRLKEGKVGGAFWSAFTLCPENGTDFSNGNYVDGKLFLTCYARQILHAAVLKIMHR